MQRRNAISHKTGVFIVSQASNVTRVARKQLQNSDGDRELPARGGHCSREADTTSNALLYGKCSQDISAGKNRAINRDTSRHCHLIPFV